jgi:hypothetical protein
MLTICIDRRRERGYMYLFAYAHKLFDIFFKNYKLSCTTLSCTARDGVLNHFACYYLSLWVATD